MVKYKRQRIYCLLWMPIRESYKTSDNTVTENSACDLLHDHFQFDVLLCLIPIGDFAIHYP